jgi:hypothetical protein
MSDHLFRTIRIGNFPCMRKAKHVMYAQSKTCHVCEYVVILSPFFKVYFVLVVSLRTRENL